MLGDMNARAHKVKPTDSRLKTVALRLTNDEWQQIKLLAAATGVAEIEMLTGWVRHGLSQVQWLKTVPRK